MLQCNNHSLPDAVLQYDEKSDTRCDQLSRLARERALAVGLGSPPRLSAVFGWLSCDEPAFASLSASRCLLAVSSSLLPAFWLAPA
jgi:hypothetical protein